MAEKESRLAQILRAELNSGKKMSESLLNALAANMKEQKDFRKIFPKQGVFGQVMRGVFGQGYRYGSKAQRESAGSSGSGLSSVTAGAIRITARNSMFLPSMARDMNIMKQNMQLLVRASGRKAYGRPETGFNKIKLGGPKKTAPKASPSAGGGVSDIAGGVVGGIFSTFSFVSSLAGSIVKGLGSVLGTGLSIGGSLISGAAGLLGSVFSGIMGVGGGILSGVLGGLASIVSGMGIFGIIALAGAGYLAYAISKSVTGSINFDDIGKQIRSFFNFKEGETFVDALYKVLGKVDEKTGMNTVGIMEKVEVQFSRFLAYSGDVLSKVIDIVQITGRLAILEMQKAFLDYGTIIIDYMGQIGGALTGMKIAPTVAAALGSAAAGATKGGVPGAIVGGIIGLLAGGATIYGGAKGGKYLSTQINNTLASGTVTDAAQKELLTRMSNDSAFLDMVSDIQDKQESLKTLEDIKDPSVKDKAIMISLRKQISQIQGNKKFKGYTDEFQKVFPGMTFGNTTDSIVETARQRKADEIELEKNRLYDRTNIDNIKSSANEAADAAESKTVTAQRERRSSSLGGSGSYKGINLDSGKSIKMRDVISYFMGKGLSFEAASGIAANLWEESGLNSGAINPSSGAFGLPQWLGGRKSDYMMWATDKGIRADDPYAQLDYIWKELSSTEKNTLNKLSASNITASKAADIFMDTFERPSESEKGTRRGRQQQLASSFTPSMEAGSTTTAKAEERKKELADPYAGKSDVELLLAAFGSMFGDLATSILELAEAGNKQAAANAGTDKGGGNVSSASSLNNDVLISEIIQSHMARQFV
jgi:hypothetical protein